MTDPQAFADSIASFQLIPVQLINLLALGLPPLEMIMGLLLVIGVHRRAASLGTTILTTIFAFALAQAMLRGLTIDCGCFGAGAPSTGKIYISLGRDLLLIAASLWLYRSSLKSSPGSRPTTTDPLEQR
jgi:uncharacterized membrane protein YphA (DoxX/SURF4 family)